jgi:hypothetical protein
MSSEESSAHSRHSSSGRACKPVKRLITQDSHTLDRQKQKEDAKKRKQKSRANAENQERERKSRLVDAVSPQRRDARNASQRVDAVSPQRRDARNASQLVDALSPQRRDARNASRRVDALSPQRRDAQNVCRRVANMPAKRRETLNSNKQQKRSANRSGEDADDEDADGETSDGAVNRDAHRYAEAIDHTCVFFMCAVCAWEGGIKSMVLIDENIREMLTKNTTLGEDFFNLCEDRTDSCIDLNYRRRVRMEMEEPGILKGIRHICVKCHQQAKKGNSSNRIKIAFSLAGGLFCGEPPEVLKQLWAVEVSMVALINPIVNISVLSAYAYTSSKPNSFCIENDVMQIAQKLPRVPTKQQRAVFVHQGFNGKPDSQHMYRPYFVHEALEWLKENNVLYRDVTLDFPAEWHDAILDSERTVAVESTQYTDEDIAPVLRKKHPASPETEETGHVANPSAVPSQEFFLVKSTDYGPTLSDLKAIARNNRAAGTTSAPAIRRSLLGATIVLRHEAPDFDAMTFPVLYPFGFGHVPGKCIDIKYVEHRICSGGYYRRFQQTANYLFTHYSFEMKRTVGGISVLAASKFKSNGMTREDACDLLAFLRDEDEQRLPVEKMARIRRIMRMVAPFAQRLPGTKVVMDQEKNKMRSLVNSPVTRDVGHWRWFVTHAQSDLHSPLLFDNIVASSAAIDYYDVNERQTTSDALSKDERVNLIRQNPVIASRIWTLQQRCYFDHVINGEALPLGGKVGDSIDKSEVQDKGTEHGHSIYSIEYDKNVPRKNRITDDSLDDFAIQDETKKTAVETLVGNVVTAKLLDADASHAWDWKLPGAQDIFSEKFADNDHPLRMRFNPDLDYRVNCVSKEPIDVRVRHQYRRIQSASFGHTCRHSCWKYQAKKSKQNRHKRFRCRYGHPVPEEQKVIGGIFKHKSDKAQVCTDYDRKNRKRR